MSRAVTISRSFRELDRYSPTGAMARKLVKQGKINDSMSFVEARKIFYDYFLEAGLEYNVHIPTFSKEKGRISLNQERLFDTFVLANAIASFLRGIDQYPAGICMLEHGFEQFSVFCHYTSIYQLIIGALSLHGICFIAHPFAGQKAETVSKADSTQGRGEIVKITPTYLGEKCLEGEYKYDKWAFVPCGFSHEERWKRYAEILKKYIGNSWASQIPDDVLRFYGYLKVIEEYRENRWRPKNTYSIKFDNLNEFKIFLNESWYLIPKIRNEAIYKNIRYDIMERVHVDKGIYPQELLDAKIKILRGFNETMIDWMCRDMKETLTKIREILNDDHLYGRSLNTVTSNPIIVLSDPDLKRIQESPELDKINNDIKEIMPLILPPDRVTI